MTTTMHEKLWSTDGRNSLDVKLNKLDKPVLTTLNDPRMADLKKKFPYLNGIWFDCEDVREQHPIHLILGVGDMAKMKIATCKMGKGDQPIAEKTILGWTLMGPEKMNTDALYFAKTLQEDYYQLYGLDALGLEDHFDGDQNLVYEEFREQLERNPDGSYSTGLPWKAGHPPLPDNAEYAKACLGGLLRKLKGKLSSKAVSWYHSRTDQPRNR